MTYVENDQNLKRDALNKEAHSGITSEQLPLTSFSGEMILCGEHYGRTHNFRIRGFLDSEFRSVPEDFRSYAALCLPYLESQAPHAYQLTCGISQGTGLELEEVAMLSLHEEKEHWSTEYSSAHCSAIIAGGRMTTDGGVVLGQNWDWDAIRYTQAGLVQFSPTGLPKTLTYHYPGLPHSCGINSSGLAVMWTGSGYWPSVQPQPGVATYALLTEISTMHSVAEVVTYLEGVKNAGAYIFFLADANGDSAIIEAIPGQLEVVRRPDFESRANLFHTEAMMRESGQSTHRLSTPSHSTSRSLVMQKVREDHCKEQKTVRIETLAEMLMDKEVFIDEKNYMTLDSFLADPQSRSLWVRRGGDPTATWNYYQL